MVAARAEGTLRHAVLPDVQQACFHFIIVLFLRRILSSLAVHPFLILCNDQRPQAFNYDDDTN